MTSSPMRRARLRRAGNLNAETSLSPVIPAAASSAARSEPVPARSEPVAFFSGEVSGGSRLLDIGLFHDGNDQENKQTRTPVNRHRLLKKSHAPRGSVNCLRLAREPIATRKSPASITIPGSGMIAGGFAPG